MNRHLLALLILLAFLSSAASARRQYTYSLHLKGIECHRMTKHWMGQKKDDVFLLLFIDDQESSTREMLLPRSQRQPYYKGFGKGSVLRLNEKIWEGNPQKVVVLTQVWESAIKRRKALSTVLDVNSILAGVGGALTGPLGAAVGGGIAVASQNEKAKLEKNNFDFAGAGRQTVEMRRVGALADKPQKKRKGIRYDFTTSHKGDKGHYSLYWEVRRR